MRLRDWIRLPPTEATPTVGADAASIDDSEILSSETGNEPFRAFGQMAMSDVVQGLLAVGERPSLVMLRRYLEGGAESLVERVLVPYLSEHVADWVREPRPFLRQARDTASRAAGLVRYYRESVRLSLPSTVVDGVSCAAVFGTAVSL